jgi:hypothetical protein
VQGTDSVAQLVEQYTFNVRVLGSNPSGITAKSLIERWGFFVAHCAGHAHRIFWANCIWQVFNWGKPVAVAVVKV